MKKIVYSSILLAISIFLFSCDGNDVKETTSRIRFINASYNSGDINVFIDYKKVFATDIQYLNYSLFSRHIATTHVIQVKTAAGNMLLDTAMDFVLGKAYSGILYDSMNTVKSMIYEEDLTTPKGSFCKLRFLHLSNNAPATDVSVGTDTSVLFRNYINGQSSEYMIYGIDSVYFNANYAGTYIPYYTQPSFVKFKAGNFYTMFLKGNTGSVGLDSVGFAVIENNWNY